MNQWDQERYERETADWAGRLSETWERLINMEVVGKIVDRGVLPFYEVNAEFQTAGASASW